MSTTHAALPAPGQRGHEGGAGANARASSGLDDVALSVVALRLQQDSRVCSGPSAAGKTAWHEKFQRWGFAGKPRPKRVRTTPSNHSPRRVGLLRWVFCFCRGLAEVEAARAPPEARTHSVRQNTTAAAAAAALAGGSGRNWLSAQGAVIEEEETRRPTQGPHFVVGPVCVAGLVHKLGAVEGGIAFVRWRPRVLAAVLGCPQNTDLYVCVF
jgi:hypothetical protein